MPCAANPHQFGGETDFCTSCGMAMTEAIERADFDCPGGEPAERTPAEVEDMWRRGMSGVGF